MPIRVLHIFAPNFRQRFGGPIFDWKYAFSKWNNPKIEHLVLDYDQRKPLNALSVFNFEITTTQQLSERMDRVIWAYQLLLQLHKHRKSYDIIHFHLIWWGSLIAARWAKIMGISTIYQSVLLGSDTPSPIRKEKLGRIKEKFLRTFSVILPISEPLSEDFYAHGYSMDQVITLMNSVDTDLFHPTASEEEKQYLRNKLELPIDATILIFTGSLIHRKGLDLLVKGFLSALQKHPELFLLLVGPQNKGENPSLDEEFVVNLKRQIAEKGASERVQFKGLIKDRERLAELYRTADGFIFPSRKEGLPNVVLEAMATGLPVIVSDLPVLQNVIKDQENGIVVTMDDPQALSQAILNLKENPGVTQQLGKNARSYVLAKHDFASWQADLIGIYQKIAAKKDI